MKKQLLSLSYKNKLSHIGSCLSAVDLIDAIYSFKKPEDKFILSAGHAGLALYCVLEKHGLGNAEGLLKECGVHPERGGPIDCSTGSLGQGLPIALGMAIADRSKHIYCLISDGEMAEGSIWEALRIAVEQKVRNLKIIVNANGWAAYDRVELSPLIERIRSFGWGVQLADGHNKADIMEGLKREVLGTPIVVFAFTQVEHFDFLKGQAAHYAVMSKKDLKNAIDKLEGGKNGEV